MADVATRPRWAEPIPRTEPDGKIVTCGCCGRDMTWRRFLEHGPGCDGSGGEEVVA